MRLLIVTTLGFILSAVPALGQNTNGVNQSGPHSYGGVNCPQQFSCLEADQSQIADIANACITKYFGFTHEEGFFDDSLGLDGNNCLAAKPDALPKYASTKTAPLCCMVPSKDNACHVHCDLVSVSAQ